MNLLLAHHCLWEVLRAGFRSMPDCRMVDGKFGNLECKFELHTTCRTLAKTFMSKRLATHLGPPKNQEIVEAL